MFGRGQRSPYFAHDEPDADLLASKMRRCVKEEFERNDEYEDEGGLEAVCWEK